MNLIDKFRVIDDFLFDRIFQPGADFAATFDIKVRHLCAACWWSAGITQFFEFSSHHLWLAYVLLIFSGSLAQFSLYIVIPGNILRPIGYQPRLFNILLGIFLNLIPSPMNLLFNTFVISALYFIACQDKPPKRRWWKELKKAIDSLVWMPEALGAKTK